MKIVNKTRQLGFSLIELMGVLAIIAVLLTAVTPNVIKFIQNESENVEEKTLETLGETFKEYVSNSFIIPTNTDWQDSIAPYTRNASTKLNTTLNGTRRLVPHPNFTLNGFPASAYDQDAAFTSSNLPISVTDARLLLISNLNADVATTSLTALQFNNLWNSSADVSGYNTDSVKIERISLISMFKSIVFSEAPSGVTHWRLNQSSTDMPWPSVGVPYYVLNNSRIFTKGSDGGDVIDVYTANAAITIGGATEGSGATSSTISGSSASAGTINCPNNTKWNSGTLYLASDQDRASHDGTMFESIVDSRNAEPSPGGNTWWAPIGACS